MLEIQLQQIEKAMKLIRVTGCKVAVLKPDGELIGDELTSPKKAGHTKRTNYYVDNYDSKRRVARMSVGDVEVFKLLPGDEVSKLQSAVSSTASVVFGSGNYTTLRVGDSIQLMREV